MQYVILLVILTRNPAILKTSVKKNSGIKEFAKTLKSLMAKKEIKKQKDQERLEAELKDIVLNNVKKRLMICWNLIKHFQNISKNYNQKL